MLRIRDRLHGAMAIPGSTVLSAFCVFQVDQEEWECEDLIQGAMNPAKTNYLIWKARSKSTIFLNSFLCYQINIPNIDDTSV